jgi:hypothetical protein
MRRSDWSQDEAIPVLEWLEAIIRGALWVWVLFRALYRGHEQRPRAR